MAAVQARMAVSASTYGQTQEEIFLMMFFLVNARLQSSCFDEVKAL